MLFYPYKKTFPKTIKNNEWNYFFVVQTINEFMNEIL